MTAAQRLAEFATTLTLDDVPSDVAHHAKLHLLDTLGCGLAAHATGVVIVIAIRLHGAKGPRR